MRLYWELTKRSFQQQITYRAATLAGLVTNFFFGLLRAAVLIALYNNRPQVEGLSLAGAITYTGLSQAVIGYLSLFGWYDLIESVHTGQVGSELLKPMNFFGFWLARDLGRAIVNLVMRGLPIMLVYALVFDITVPGGAGQWLAFLLALFLGWLVSFAWRYLINLSAFWVPNAVGIGRLAYTMSWFLSGFLMPLRFFPEWFQRICYLTPFPQAVNTVMEVYLGLVEGPDLIAALLGQALWAAGLILAGELALQAGVRRLVIQGG
jgi:ABC-2 type transport system permease protein